MLNTINGIDLMLVFIIAGLWINVYKLNQECESYVDQLIDLSRDNYELSGLKYPHLSTPPQDPYEHEYKDYCACSSCIPF
jgi:hypothetical protein